MCGRKALDLSSSGLPHAFQITNWAWSLVKAGKIEEVLHASLLGDGDSASNPKAIMERFVLVGILCAHVMVALRPTILDALKMLEGDIERKRLGVLRVSLRSSGCGNGGGGGGRESRVAMESTLKDARDGAGAVDVDLKPTVGGGVEDVYGEDRATEDQI
ncbi:hypothetical protein RHMOL_Rhmol05G0041100 [Rhododendron molle]|uniref:Uncharacterized protein n=1 Tax=Rhododendron molle TaxID=49168 RepID=A0ACC0NLJ5_RHOML|nr:hypothetical protein RHMOL_Rhmol05G0041100 [Rhododendron molle]